jgi:hypothetical protein
MARSTYHQVGVIFGSCTRTVRRAHFLPRRRRWDALLCDSWVALLGTACNWLKKHMAAKGTLCKLLESRELCTMIASPA